MKCCGNKKQHTKIVKYVALAGSWKELLDETLNGLRETISALRTIRKMLLLEASEKGS